MRLKKTRRYILTFSAVVFALLCHGVFAAAAAEKWRTVIWDDSSAFMEDFDALCAGRGLVSSDVLEANGYPGLLKRFPSKGEELLVPESEDDFFVTWMEVQNRNGGAKPSEIETELEKPSKPVEPKNMTIVVSGDEVVVQTPDDGPQDGIRSLIFDPALASRDLIIPNPPVMRPVVRPPAVTHGKMMWPVSGKVTSGFGRRGRRRMHHGIDIPMPKGTPIAAALDGVVTDTATNRDRNYRGYGNTVVIDHGNGTVMLYAHCSKLNDKKGQKVRQGEIVAFVGGTGRVTTNHVHFEVRKNGSAVDPIPYLAPR